MLADAFWPGPLTLVVRRNAGACRDEVTGGRDTVGLRVPDHPLALELLDAFGGGVAAPSANRFGRVSPTTAAHVRADLGDDVDVVLDGGPCRVGVESTIVDVTGAEPAILRVGGVQPSATSRRSLGRACRAANRAARSRRRARSRRTTRRRARVELVDAATSTRARTRCSPRGRAGRAARAGAGPRDAAGRRSSCSTRRATSTSTRACSTRGCAKPTTRGLDVLLVVLPPATDGLGAAVADRLRRAAATDAGYR